TLDAVKAFCVGTWESLSVELRPTEDRAGTGVIEPTRLTRRFEYHSPERFTGAITMFMDDYGAAPLMRFTFRGHLKWGGEHPIADGAWCIDYVLDQGFDVDPLHEGAVQMLNAGLPEGMDPFAVDKTSSILGKPFPLFGIEAGQTLVDHDLLYFRNGLLFMGAKHVDGTPFDRPERRPHQLQIPLARA
ncbi:MAG: hypothetical protein AAFU79_20540, partial [Myxococcota bacterium]